MMNQTTLNEKYAALPAFSRKVYDALITKGLYAEPYFTDVDTDKLAYLTGEKVEAIKGALAKLYEVGLAYPVQQDHAVTKKVGRTIKVVTEYMEFIGAEAHDLELDHPGK